MKKQVIGHAGIPGGVLLTEDSRSSFVAVKFSVYPLNDPHFNSVSGLRRTIDGLLARDAHPALAA